jgi:hypothetical protein
MKKFAQILLAILVFESLHSMDFQKSQNFNRIQPPRLEISRNDVLNNVGLLISTGPPESARVGNAILERGGNAIDAAFRSLRLFTISGCVYTR